MGSPSARLNLAEELRPWLESGLEFVFQPGGVAAEEAVSEATRAAAPVQAPTPRPVAPSAPRAVQAPPAPVARPAAPTPAPAPPSGAAAEFPPNWARFLLTAKPNSTPKVIWTYMELGLDLSGQADPKRRAVLGNLQNHLRWPKGTINFWPVSALVNGTLQPDTRMFWKGWELWRTPTIVCFGEEALRVILPEANPAATTHMLEQVIVHVLPPLARLTTMLPHEQQLAVDALTKIRL